jgi:hypothetical protein
MTQTTWLSPAAPVDDQCAVALGWTGPTRTTLVSTTVSPLAVTKSTTIEYVRAVDAVLVAVPVSRQPRAPSEAQPVVTTFFLALSAATYFGTLTDPVPDAVPAPDPAPVPAAVAAAWAALAGGEDTVAAGVGEPELQADNARASGRAATAPPTASLTGVLLAVLMITTPFLFSGEVTVRR